MSKEEILAKIKETLVKDFDCDEAALVPEARFYEDLDIDSIDAVDLIVRMRNEVPFDVSADEFKSMRTIGDLAELLERLVNGQGGK